MICILGILMQQVMKWGRDSQRAYSEQQGKHHPDNRDPADAQLPLC
jgi:hypothetical protein